jgi:hypothetical protein
MEGNSVQHSVDEPDLEMITAVEVLRKDATSIISVKQGTLRFCLLFQDFRRNSVPDGRRRAYAFYLSHLQ